MKPSLRVFASLAAMLALCADARADGDALRSVYAQPEVKLRLVVAPPTSGGAVRGALLVDLGEGWHTYWRDPGASGIPPTLDFSKTPKMAKAQVRFEAPQRFGEDLTRGNGYLGNTAFAFRLDPVGGGSIASVNLHVFMGVCRQICIPVEADLATVPDPDAADLVASAFEALPATGERGGHIVSAAAASDGEALKIEIEAADEPHTPDLFVTGPDGWYFDEPRSVATDGHRVTFEVPVAERPTSAEKAPATVDIVYTDGSSAFEATAPVSQPTDGSATNHSK